MKKGYSDFKKKIARLDHKITNTRWDYLYTIADNPSKNPIVIVIVIVMKDLKVAHMFKPATGNLENPKRNVKVKSGNIRNMRDISDYSLLNVNI